MADSAASSTPGAPRSPTTKRRARAASSETDDRPARTALSVEEPAPLRRAARGNGAAGDRPLDLFAANDAVAATHTMNFDPRQGTLDGFELQADALALLREREALGASGAVAHAAAAHGSASSADTPNAAATRKLTDEPGRDESTASGAPGNKTPADNAVNIAPPPRKTPARRPAERAASAGPTEDARSSDAMVQTAAALQATLAGDRRAARESRRFAMRLVSIAIAILLIVVVLGVVQTVVSMRAARESAAAQEKTEALLRAQQTQLAAFIDAASAASADIRVMAGALDAKLAAPPARMAAGEPPAVKHAPRPLHPRKTNEKTRSSTAY